MYIYFDQFALLMLILSVDQLYFTAKTKKENKIQIFQLKFNKMKFEMSTENAMCISTNSSEMMSVKLSILNVKHNPSSVHTSLNASVSHWAASS